jgi:hypothetical protein
LSGIADFEIGSTPCGTAANILYAHGNVANLAHTVYGVAGSVAVYAMTNTISSSAGVAKITLTESRDDAIAISISTLHACFDPTFYLGVPCYPITGTVHMLTNMEPKLTKSISDNNNNNNNNNNTATNTTTTSKVATNAELLVTQDCDALFASVSLINWLYTSVRYPHLDSIVGIKLELLDMVPLMDVLQRDEERRMEMVDQLLGVTCNGESLLRPKEEKNFINSNFLSVGMGLVGLSCFVFSIFGLLLWFRRKHMALKTASPFFMAEVLAGALLVLSTIIPLSTQDDHLSQHNMDVVRCISLLYSYVVHSLILQML